MLPRSIRAFIDIFSGLPAIGPRSAMRLAFHLIGLGQASIAEIADAVRGLGTLTTCPDCFFFSEGPQCSFCGNPDRKKDVLAVVLRPTDVLAIEKTRRFNGVYLVLGEIGKVGGFSPDQKLKLARAKSRGPFAEVIVAFDQTTYGDFNAGAVMKEFQGSAAKMTRLGRGIPTGGEIEFADEDTLGGALQNRS